MQEATLTLTNDSGLHLRPAAKFVEIASRYRAEVFLRRGELEVNAKSILGVLMLAAEMGAEIVVRTEGPDEAEAMAALTELVEGHFGQK
jgi:phosphocarrier protein HPr